MQGFGEEYAFGNKKEDCLPNTFDLATCSEFPINLRKRLGEKILSVENYPIGFLLLFIRLDAHGKSSGWITPPVSYKMIKEIINTIKTT
ncbi:hypothetical protein Barb7_00857 [Bacteroidales bacterium Barb7]|nr:hypothetical protein Barb7_00857 [Bacteroidales bacterium Barb7]